MAVRNTRQRTAIRDTLTQSGRPLSPEELLVLAKREVPRLSIATVYRALRDLEEGGFARAVTIAGQPRRYELSDLEHHHHFCCRQCDRVFDIPGCPGNMADLAPSGFAVDDHDLVLYGRCEACS